MGLLRDALTASLCRDADAQGVLTVGAQGRPSDEFFAIQAASLKGRGGIETAVLSYGDMFNKVGVPSLCLYDGPGGEALESAGLAYRRMPKYLARPSGLIPGMGRSLRNEILMMAEGRRLLFIIHSDRTLAALRRLFPDDVFVTPCHSDKTKGKRRADIAVTLNSAQHEVVSRGLAGSRCRAALLGNPFECQGRGLAQGDETRFIFCARFIEAKNPLPLLRAHADLVDPPPLVMIGDGQLMEEARRLAGPGVTFTGWRSDPWAEITAADILVSASSWEGLPYLVQEALGRAVPVVASDIPAHRFALNDGAYGDLFPLGEHRAFVDALKSAVMNLPDLRRKAEAGQAALPRRFGPEAFWANLLAEIGKLPNRNA